MEKTIELYMQDLYIRADYRRYGIASSLIHSILEKDSESPLNWLCLTSNGEGKKFYEKIGGKQPGNFLYQWIFKHL